VEVTTAVQEDLDEIEEIVGACLVQLRSMGVEQWDEQYPTRAHFEEDLSLGTLFIAEQAGAIVGTIVLNEHQEEQYGEVPWRHAGGKPLIVHRLLIHPDQQRKASHPS